VLLVTELFQQFRNVSSYQCTLEAFEWGLHSVICRGFEEFWLGYKALWLGQKLSGWVKFFTAGVEVLWLG